MNFIDKFALKLNLPTEVVYILLGFGVIIILSQVFG